MQLIKSKRFWVTMLGSVAAVTAGSQDQPWYVVLALGIGAAAFVVSQGMADHGKEAAKLSIESALKGAEEARKRASAETDPAPAKD